MDFDERCLVPRFTLLVHSRCRLHHLIISLYANVLTQSLVTGHLVDRLIKYLVAEFEHLYEIKRNEMIS